MILTIINIVHFAVCVFARIMYLIKSVEHLEVNIFILRRLPLSLDGGSTQPPGHPGGIMDVPPNRTDLQRKGGTYLFVSTVL